MREAPLARSLVAPVFQTTRTIKITYRILAPTCKCPATACMRGNGIHAVCAADVCVCVYVLGVSTHNIQRCTVSEVITRTLSSYVFLGQA